MTAPRHAADAPPTRDPDPDRLPPFGEQMAEQLGGWRGMVESSIPVVVFVVVNILTSLRPALIRQPVIGWAWSVIAAGGTSEWRRDPRLLRAFTWLTVVWAVVWILKVSAQAWLYLEKQDDWLGIARLTLGVPPYLLLIALTVWVVRRVTRDPAESPA